MGYEENAPTTKIRITDIRCPGCGAPAKFDIMRQKYLCAYCGGQVGIGEACRQKQGFRKIRGDRLKSEVGRFRLVKTNCSGCGAVVVFEESEAVSNCAFCGRSLVRGEYLDTEGLPEFVIPFALTGAEAKERLLAWCAANRGKPEARHLRAAADELKGVYLPYELVNGPVHMKASRMDRGRTYSCEGFINDEFVSRCSQLDNLLLDGMEPFDTESLTDFDFAYVAGHRVRISDITDKELEGRAGGEVAEAYAPAVRKTLETKAVYVDADVSSAVGLPVLLPVYYICRDGMMAAVNGQTGRVSVRAEKESHYFFVPWWVKAILSTAAVCGLLEAALHFLGGMAWREGLVITGMLGIVFIIIALCVFSDTAMNSFSVEAGRKIFTSGGSSFHRERGRLVQNDRILERKAGTPVFFQNVDGQPRPCVLKFTTFPRVLKMVLLCLIALFLPVIFALLINGFDFERLTLGGSAVWFCIMVPVVPVYLLKLGIVDMYDKPLVYLYTDRGKLRRWRPKPDLKITWQTVKTILRVVFVPPVSLAVWAGIVCFCIMVYLTAFGFD